MSDNRADGYTFYHECGPESQDWFHKQWTIWPERADSRYTTNLNFHYGAITAFREINAFSPPMSESLFENIAWLDRNSMRG